MKNVTNFNTDEHTNLVLSWAYDILSTVLVEEREMKQVEYIKYILNLETNKKFKQK